MQKKPLLIEFMGGPGSGKTSLAMGLSSKLKLDTTLRVKYLPEVASDYINRGFNNIFGYPNFVTQTIIMGSFLEQLYGLSALQTEVIITDCGINQSLEFTEDLSTKNYMKEVQRKIENSFIYRGIIVERVKKFLTFGRYHSEHESDSITANLKRQADFPVVHGTEQSIIELAKEIQKEFI